MPRSKGEIEVIVDEEGNVTLEVKGVKGTSCVDLTKDLEKELGKVGYRKFKPEHRTKREERLHHRGH